MLMIAEQTYVVRIRAIFSIVIGQLQSKIGLLIACMKRAIISIARERDAACYV